MAGGVKEIFSKRTMIGGATAFIIGLGGCYGRPKTQINSSMLCHSAGLQPGQPAVVTFSANWCHPCREEIDSLNQANREFAGLIQFRGFLVEGEEKGSPVHESDLSSFTSFTGSRAEYAVRTDPGWQLFDSLHAPQGHSLPTLVIMSQSCKVEEVVQQSLDYQTQLRPLLLALTRGQSAPPVAPVDPTPVPTKPDQQQLNDTVEHWLSRAEVVANPALIKNFTDSWEAGLQKYNFNSSEMPLNDGQINFLWDGASEDIPQTAAWRSDTPVSVCTLNLTLNADGTLLSSSGKCRLK